MVFISVKSTIFSLIVTVSLIMQYTCLYSSTVHPVIFLQWLSSVTRYFELHSQSIAEYENEVIPKIHVTAEDLLWYLSTEEFSEYHQHWNILTPTPGHAGTMVTQHPAAGRWLIHPGRSNPYHCRMNISEYTTLHDENTNLQSKIHLHKEHINVIKHSYIKSKCKQWHRYLK